jgi:hypothetical protein
VSNEGTEPNDESEYLCNVETGVCTTLARGVIRAVSGYAKNANRIALVVEGPQYYVYSQYLFEGDGTAPIQVDPNVGVTLMPDGNLGVC